MKFFIILFSIIAFVSGIKQVSFKLRPESVQKIKIASEECAFEFNVDPAVLQNLVEGTLPKDKNHDMYLFCIVRKINFIKDDGHLNIEIVATPIKEHPLVEKFKESLRKCDEVIKEDPFETAAEIYHCYLDNAPILFAI